MNKIKPNDIVSQAINPDVIVIIEHDSVTGKVIIKSGNGKPLNSLMVSQLCISVGKANLDNYIAQALKSAVTAERTATNPPHNFVRDPLTPEICSFCSFPESHHITVVQ